MNWFSKFFSNGILSGRWVGHYQQHGRSFPVEASFKHRGGKLFGTMFDLEPGHQQPLRAVLEETGHSDSDISKFIDGVRSHFPDSLDGEIEYRAWLPEKSMIEGSVVENELSFVKRYEGYHEIEYVLGGLALPESIPCDLVEYTGKLSFDSESISGNWTIAASNGTEIELSGAFKLTRKSGR